MTTESSRTAAQDGAHDLELLETNVAVSIDEVVALRAKDVGHLHGGPGHGFCFLLDRFIVSSLEIDIVSIGLTTACR